MSLENGAAGNAVMVWKKLLAILPLVASTLRRLMGRRGTLLGSSAKLVARGSINLEGPSASARPNGCENAVERLESAQTVRM